MLSTVVRAEEELRELPVEPVWIGVLTLVSFAVLLMVVLIFGKGRPHA